VLLRVFSWPILVLVLLAGLISFAWLARVQLLQEAASLWVVSNRLTHADAIVVLGGDFQSRPVVAAMLYHRGLANKILISQTGDGPNDTLSYTELTRATLIKRGVPPEAIEPFGNLNKNTRDEAVAIGQWAKRNAATVFIIPDEFLDTRRASWILHRELGDQAIIELFPFDPPTYTSQNWWRSEQGVIKFQTELIKYLYYRLKY
jgi:hypothetical protein